MRKKHAHRHRTKSLDDRVTTKAKAQPAVADRRRAACVALYVMPWARGAFEHAPPTPGKNACSRLKILEVQREERYPLRGERGVVYW